MNKKLLPPELIDLLTSNTGTTRKSNEAFVRSFFELIEEVLQKESFVKIKGFGTFKLVSVNERESVKINTGERYQINSHTKITFTPDTTLKDLINKPFSHFETIILPESTTNEELDAIDAECNLTLDCENITIENNDTEIAQVTEKEIVETGETAKNENQSQQTEVTNDKSTSSKEEQINKFLSEKEQLTSFANSEISPLTPTDNITKKEATDNLFEDLTNINIIVPTITSTEQNTPPSNIKETENQELTASFNQNTSDLDTSTIEANINKDMSSPSTYSQKLRNILICLLLVTMSYIAGYHHLIPLGYNPIEPSSTIELHQQADGNINDTTLNETLTELTPTIEADTLTEAQKLRKSLPDTLSVIRGLDKESIDLLWKSYPQVEVGSFYIIGTFKSHRLKPGETLYRLARQTYGHKDYVKYIILYNKFTDPNNVAVDKEILLPWLVEKVINNENPNNINETNQ